MNWCSRARAPALTRNRDKMFCKYYGPELIAIKCARCVLRSPEPNYSLTWHSINVRMGLCTLSLYLTENDKLTTPETFDNGKWKQNFRNQHIALGPSMCFASPPCIENTNESVREKFANRKCNPDSRIK